MTETRCGIWLCEWVGDPAELVEHERAEHPTAVRAREGLAAWRSMLSKNPAPNGSGARGREPSADAALPESPRRVHADPSLGRGSAQIESRPRAKCVYCARAARPFRRTCESHADIEQIEDGLV